jgi:hypothetical protein
VDGAKEVRALGAGLCTRKQIERNAGRQAGFRAPAHLKTGEERLESIHMLSGEHARVVHVGIHWTRGSGGETGRRGRVRNEEEMGWGNGELQACRYGRVQEC